MEVGTSAAGTLSVVAAGLGFVEGPRWHDGQLWFSDFYARTVSSVDPNGVVTRHAYVAGQPSGLGFDPDGALLVVSTHEGHILRITAEGTTLLADVGAVYRGGLNDMVVGANGVAYVSTFPRHVVGARVGQFHGEPLAPVIAVRSDGAVQIAADDLLIPNGMAITDDGSTLIVAETSGSRLTAFDIADDGSLQNRRIFADLGTRRPDGICLDSAGNVWFGSPFTSEFVLVEAQGRVLRTIDTPGRWAVACALGGDDSRTLWCATVEVTLDEYRQGRGRGAIEACTLDDGT